MPMCMPMMFDYKYWFVVFFFFKNTFCTFFPSWVADFIMSNCMEYIEPTTPQDSVSHSSMLCKIEKQENIVRVKRLEQLAVDLICCCVSNKNIDEHVDSNMLLFRGLPLPHNILDIVVSRFDYVVTKYFELFIEPTIIYDHDERLSVSVIFG